MRNDEIRERIRKLREQKGISQKDFARMVGMQPSKLSELETGKKKGTIHLDDLPKFAKALGVTEYKLLTNIDDDKRDIAEALGLDNTTIQAIQQMDKETRTAMALLINDPLFFNEWKAYIFATEQGLYKKGNKIVSENEYVTVGSYGSFGGGYQVGTLVNFVREQNIIGTLRSIKERMKQNETSKR